MEYAEASMLIEDALANSMQKNSATGSIFNLSFGTSQGLFLAPGCCIPAALQGHWLHPHWGVQCLLCFGDLIFGISIGQTNHFWENHEKPMCFSLQLVFFILLLVVPMVPVWLADAKATS